MIRHRWMIAAGSVVVVAALAVVFRAEIEHAAVTLGTGIVGYKMLRHRYFPKAVRSGSSKTLIEVAVAAAGGWFAARHLPETEGKQKPDYRAGIRRWLT